MDYSNSLFGSLDVRSGSVNHMRFPVIKIENELNSQMCIHPFTLPCCLFY